MGCNHDHFLQESLEAYSTRDGVHVSHEHDDHDHGDEAHGKGKSKTSKKKHSKHQARKTYVARSARDIWASLLGIKAAAK